MAFTEINRATLINITARAIERFTANIYIASLPIITLDLIVSHRIVQISMVTYFMGLILSQIIGSSLGDRYPKTLLLISPLLLFFGSLLIVFFGTSQILMLGRFIQALGVGWAPVVANAYLSDVSLKFENLKDNRHAIKVFSQLSIFAAWVPAIAMYIGSVIENYFGWQASFVILILISVITFGIFYFVMPRHHPHPQIIAISSLKKYFILFKSNEYILPVIGFALLVSGLTAYYLLSSFIYHRVFNLSTRTIALLAFAQVGSYLAGRLFTPAIYVKHGEYNLRVFASMLALSSAFLMLILNLYCTEHVICILLPLVIYSYAAGVLAPCINVCIMRLKPGFANSAEGLFNIVVTLTNIIISILTTQLAITSAIPLSILLILLSGMATLFFIIKY